MNSLNFPPCMNRTGYELRTTWTNSLQSMTSRRFCANQSTPLETIYRVTLTRYLLVAGCLARYATFGVDKMLTLG